LPRARGRKTGAWQIAQRELSRIITTAYALVGEELGFHPAMFQRGDVSTCNEKGFTLPEGMHHD
jgi:hypothetical protein